MGITGYSGTFVISCDQCEVDGLAAPTLDALCLGSVWRWSGMAMRVDGAADVLTLGRAHSLKNRRNRATRFLSGRDEFQLPAVLAEAAFDIGDEDGQDDPELPEGAFTVTDGHQRYVVKTMPSPTHGTTLLTFADVLPPKDQDLWVVEMRLSRTGRSGLTAQSGMICFVPGTRIACPDGPKLVRDLRAGDLIQTRDNGAQPLMWAGSAQLSGARLYATPELRPVRIRAGALGVDEPDSDLLVSPDHRLLVKGDRARALFASDEVLVSARDLIDDARILVDPASGGVTYHHLMLESHQVLTANGVDCESFHPVSTDLNALPDSDRMALIETAPDVYAQPGGYGAFARRTLSSAEVCIMKYDGARAI